MNCRILTTMVWCHHLTGYMSWYTRTLQYLFFSLFRCYFDLTKSAYSISQEVIKAISGKGDPLKNFFLFDVVDGKGVIEDISNPTET